MKLEEIEIEQRLWWNGDVFYSRIPCSQVRIKHHKAQFITVLDIDAEDKILPIFAEVDEEIIPGHNLVWLRAEDLSLSPEVAKNE